MIPAHRANYEWQARFRCGRSFVSTIGYSSVFNPIMPTGPATIPSLTANVCICLYFRFPSACVRLRMRTSGSVCRVCAFNHRDCVCSHLRRRGESTSPYTRCTNFHTTNTLFGVIFYGGKITCIFFLINRFVYCGFVNRAGKWKVFFKREV